MAITFSYFKEENILKVTSSGFDETIEEVVEYGMNILAKAIEEGVENLLVDERNLEYRMSTLDTFELAEIASHRAKDLNMIAVVCNPKFMEDATFYETVAQNRGLTIRVFSKMEDASKWIND